MGGTGWLVMRLDSQFSMFKNRTRMTGVSDNPMPENNVQASEAIKTVLTDMKKMGTTLVERSQSTLGQQHEIDDLIRTQNALAKLDDHVNGFREKLERLVPKLKDQRSRELQASVHKFASEIRKSGTLVQETSDGYRLGELFLECRPSQGQIRFTYNRASMHSWVKFSSPKELKTLHTQSLRRLHSTAIPDALLKDIFFETYLSCDELFNKKGWVKIEDFYLPLRKALISSELSTRANVDLSKFASFPNFAFLYNLDRYRTIRRKIDQNKRLNFEFGAQSETGKFGVLLGGLNNYDLKKLCWIFRDISP